MPLEIEGRVAVEAEKELAGPPLSSGGPNAGSSAHWSVGKNRSLSYLYSSHAVFALSSVATKLAARVGVVCAAGRASPGDWLRERRRVGVEV